MQPLSFSHLNATSIIFRVAFSFTSYIEEIGKEKADFIMNVLGYKVIDSKDIILSPKLLKK